MTVTFFGHRHIEQDIVSILESTIINQIEFNNANLFYVGNQGNFDYTVKSILKKLKVKYPQINYYVVLAYIPTNKEKFDYMDFSDTIYPDGLENTPPRYAISKRNRWMIEKSDTVITYVTHQIGGAAQFKELSEKKGKNVINIADMA